MAVLIETALAWLDLWANLTKRSSPQGFVKDVWLLIELYVLHEWFFGSR